MAANPRRRRAHRRRSYRYASNPGSSARRSTRLLSDPIGAIKDTILSAFSKETLETVFHSAIGFGGTLVASRFLSKKVFPMLGETPVARVATSFGVSVLGSLLLGFIGGARLASRSFAGGLLATGWQVLSEVLPPEAKEIIPTLGEGPETASFRRAIESEMLREMRGGGNEGMSVYLQPAGIQETYMTPAGSETYLTSGEGNRLDQSGVSAYLTKRELVASESGVGDADSEFGGRSLPERF